MTHFTGKQPVERDQESLYQFPKFLPLHAWALSGKWKIGAEKIVSAEPGAALQLNFKARKVFLVLGTATGKPVSVSVLLNGEEVGPNAGADTRQGKITPL